MHREEEDRVAERSGDTFAAPGWRVAEGRLTAADESRVNECRKTTKYRPGRALLSR